MTLRCGVIAIAGTPNAGKSTLINRLVGGKVSIVTHKVQTTRFNVRGVCAHEQTQFIFVDTPGLFDAKKPLEKALVDNAWQGISDADAVLLIIDGKHGISETLATIMQQLQKRSQLPLYIAINKIDEMDKNALLALAAACHELARPQQIFMISALKGDGVEDIKKSLAPLMPEGPWHYPEDTMSDIPMRLLAAEITREKLFLNLNQELPYSLAVENESWEEGDTLIKISQVIYVQREGQKKIVIGKGGEGLKRVGTASRKELEAMLEKKVHLNLFVKVKDKDFTLIPSTS
ncbi:MAG: GTPase Era [Alphaproteobacteria bacterium]